MITTRLCRSAAIGATTALLFGAQASAQQAPPGCNWKNYLYAQDAVQQGKIDTTCLTR